MKHSIAFALALSALASSAAFASSEVAMPHGFDQQASLATASAATNKLAAEYSLKPFDSKASSPVIVAENRKEFGSRYERNE